MTLHPNLYKPPTHIQRFPAILACGALISVDGTPDHACPTLVQKSSANQRCPGCQERRRELAKKRRNALVRKRGR